MLDSKYFRMGVWTVLVFVIILLATQISFIFKPLVILFEAFFLPVILAGLVYFLLSPLVNYLAQHKIPKVLSILIIYLLVGGGLTLVIVLMGPVLYHQVESLVQNAPAFIIDLQNGLMEMQENPFFQRFLEIESYSPESIAETLSVFLGSLIKTIGNNIMSFIGMITNFIMVLILVPFIAFYMLKDDHRLPPLVLRHIPQDHRRDAQRILTDMHKTLGSYIKGQITVSLCVGIMIYIGLLIIGIDYALLLASIALFTNLVPFIGPIIGTIPALIIALLTSPLMALNTLILIVVVQQVESLFISPKIMGHRLAIHPIIIIFIILFASRFAGFIGIILGVPAFAVARVVFVHSKRLWHLRHKSS